MLVHPRCSDELLAVSITRRRGDDTPLPRLVASTINAAPQEADIAKVAYGSKRENLAVSIFSPDYPQEQTYSRRAATSHSTDFIPHVH
jgi:hypothetical protein